jgi:hypothetical protein
LGLASGWRIVRLSAAFDSPSRETALFSGILKQQLCGHGRCGWIADFILLIQKEKASSGCLFYLHYFISQNAGRIDKYFLEWSTLLLDKAYRITS